MHTQVPEIITSLHNILRELEGSLCSRCGMCSLQRSSLLCLLLLQVLPVALLSLCALQLLMPPLLLLRGGCLLRHGLYRRLPSLNLLHYHRRPPSLHLLLCSCRRMPSLHLVLRSHRRLTGLHLVLRSLRVLPHLLFLRLLELPLHWRSHRPSSLVCPACCGQSREAQRGNCQSNARPGGSLGRCCPLRLFGLPDNTGAATAAGAAAGLLGRLHSGAHQHHFVIWQRKRWASASGRLCGLHGWRR